MYKILIVDDEAIEREALRRIVMHEYGDRCQVEMATNGKEAIDMAEMLRADIIIMDIEMPGINGLEAAGTIKEMLPRCRIIIVTAYERFQYAQHAISLGVEEYLLKPVANAALFRLLRRAMEDIDTDRRDADRRGALDLLAREQFVLSVISGYSSALSLDSQLRELGIAFGHGFFFVARSTGPHGADKIVALVRPFLDRTPDITALLYEYDDSVLGVALMNDTFLSEQDLLETGLALVDYADSTAGIPLRVGAGSVVTSLTELRASYHLALETLAACTAEAPVRLAAALKDEDQDEARQRGLEKRLYGFLVEKDIDGALRCVETMFDTLDYCLRHPEAVQRAVHQIVAGVSRRLRRDAGLPGDVPAAVDRLADETLTRQEMAIAIRALLAEWIAALDEQPPARMQRIRAEIERYLRAHYAEDLSIRQVARAMHYSEPYFSKLFSRCFHKNFVTYLTDIRMQAARDMLENTVASIREVSTAVGFMDANYFAKVFRKAYGISPTEYRRYIYGQGMRREGEASE